MRNLDFDVLLIGTDINAYYMARNFHEAYGIKVNLLGKVPMKFTTYSTICNVVIEPNLWDNEIFKARLAEYGASMTQGKKTILVATNDTYVRMIVENAEFLSQWYVFNHINEEQLNNLVLKENFYKRYENSNIINIPKTYSYKCHTDQLDINKVKELAFPLIVKPADTVKWYEHEFDNRAKVYKPETLGELQKIISDAETAGYRETLIIQQFIAGDDSHLFDSMFYVSSDGDIQLQTFAQIGLQEHNPLDIGSCTVLVNGYNQFNNTDEIKDNLKQFLIDIKYRGICEFDLKYDPNRKKFYVFEINPRQARCGYYLTACGHNLANYLVNDLIYGKKSEFTFITKEQALSFVPLHVIKKHISNKAYTDKVLALHQKGAFTRVLDYKGDKCLKRKLWLKLRDLKYAKKYKKHQW
jgi:D-aspartate ligase